MRLASPGSSSGVLAWCAFVVGSSVVVPTSTVASYGVRAATVLAVAALLIRAARRGGPLSRARGLLATAMLVGAGSGAGAAMQALLTGAAAPLGNWTDYVQLMYVPFAVAGLVLVPTSVGERLRTVGDAMVAAGSLWYLSLVLIADPSEAGLPTPARLVAMAYLLGPPLVVAVLLSILPGTTGAARSFLLRVAAAMVVVSAADLCFALAALDGSYDAGSWIAAIHQAGLALLLWAAATTSRTDRSHAGGTRPPWRATIDALTPFVPLVAAVAVALGQYLGGGGFTRAQTVPILVIGVAAVLRHGSAVHAHVRLVQDLRQREQAARAESLRDPLTGLANRTAFVEHLAGLLGDDSARPTAVAVLDLNDFKHVNDNHGHEAGDHLLQACGERLRAALPPSCFVARLGGDEFAICRPGVGDGVQSLVDAIAVAFEAPFVIGLRPFTVRPSVGVVVDERAAGRGGADEGAHLVAHADVAMYQAKANKDGHGFPAVVLTGAARERATNLIRIREEISRPDMTQFRVVYQPVVDLRTGTMTGVEALLRWRHPVFGELSPATFIPLAEQVGAVALLGRYVLTTALADLRRWGAVASTPGFTVAVNLSPRELGDPDLSVGVLETIRAHGLVPSQLVLEITEGALMTNLHAAVRTVAQLRHGGVSVAVDDFGTGQSSLRYLRRFDADVIKIDREFITSVSDDDRTATLVRLVVDMAAALGLRTIAEGIEDPDQLRAVIALGCDAGQGFLFGEPVEADAVERLLADGHRYCLDPCQPAHHRTTAHPSNASDPCQPEG